MAKKSGSLKKDQVLYVGKLIKSKRKEKGMTQRELADLVDRTTGTISDLERGRGYFNYRTVSAIAKILDIPMGDITGDYAQPKEDKYVDKTTLADLLKVRELVREQPTIYLGDKELSKESRIILDGMIDMIIDRETQKQKKSPGGTED